MLWSCQFVKQDIATILPNIHSVFWKNVVELWTEINFNDPISPAQVKEQIIWNNSNIRINGKPFFLKKWVDNGILKIKDILSDNNNFLSFKECQNCYGGFINVVTYYGILEAIPKPWKRMLGERDMVAYDELLQKVKHKPKVV